MNEPRLVLVSEFVHCQLMVQQLRGSEESYARSTVEVSDLELFRCEEHSHINCSNAAVF